MVYSTGALFVKVYLASFSVLLEKRGGGRDRYSCIDCFWFYRLFRFWIDWLESVVSVLLWGKGGGRVGRNFLEHTPQKKMNNRHEKKTSVEHRRLDQQD